MVCFIRIWQRYSCLKPSYYGALVLLCGLLVVLNACGPSQSGGEPTSNIRVDTVTPTTGASSIPPSIAPTISLQVGSGCPSLDWDKLAGTQPGVNKVQEVICASLEGSGILDALVKVRYYSADATLDVYVYNDLSGSPKQIFSDLGLLNGNAQINSVGRLSTLEVSPKDTVKGFPDLFKDYVWNGSSFEQYVFNGIYPDMTQYQADRDQALVSLELTTPGAKQLDIWKLSAGGVASHLAANIFHWANTTQRVLSGTPQKQVTVSVSVTNNGPGGGGFTATLTRLNGSLSEIFEVTQISPFDTNISLASPVADATLHTPVSVSGTSLASGSLLGQAVVYDDMYVQVGTSGPISTQTTSGYVPFSTSVTYELNASGMQEGLVVFYPTNQNNILISNQVVVEKVFLTG